MSTDLLKREKELTKLNEQLKKQSKQILLEAETVMNLNKYGVSDTLENIPEQIKTEKTEKKDKNYSDSESYVSDNWDGFPEGCQNMNKKALMQYLKSKVIILQNDVDALKSKYKSKLNEIKQLEQDYEKVQEERNKWKRQAELYKDQKEKSTQQVTTLHANLQTKESQIVNLKKENDVLTKELKTINLSSSGQNVKLNKATEELEKVKANLQNAKKIEKELRESHRRELADLTSNSKKLEKQNNELVAGFKKQMLLVDNLKRQKMYLESLKVTDYVEEEFLKLLDWKPPQNTSVKKEVK